MKVSRWLVWVALLLAVNVSAEPLPKRWVYYSVNLWVDKNLDTLEAVLRRAAKAGYNGVLVADSKFGKLGDMDERYFRNIDRVKKLAAELKLEIVPAVFPIGYSESLLWHDPNLVEALPVRDALFVVENGVARPVGLRQELRKPDWKDDNLVAEGDGWRVTDPKGQNSRVVFKLKVEPFRQYHVSVRVKTQDFTGTPEVKVLVGDHSLNHAHLGVKRTQDWAVQHAVFNSLANTEVRVYFGCWDGRTGSLAWAEPKIEVAGLLNVVRRDGAPLVVKRENVVGAVGGAASPPRPALTNQHAPIAAGTPLPQPASETSMLVEGRDFEPVADPRMGTVPWKGGYEVWHEPPPLRVKSLADGTQLRVSYHHTITVYDGQVMICPSEPKTVALLRDQAKRMHAAWGAKGYFMSHDEIRVLNWDDSCARRQLDAGAIVADNVRTCIRILREVNPGGDIYVWSDMFDPHHNAHKDYYLVRGDLAGSWEGLDKDVIVVPWYFGKRNESLKWFADRGHRQLIAGYYDAAPEKVRDWLDAAKKVNGVIGVMYTTWQNQYTDLESFLHHAQPD